jgi:PEP-CTERM motif
VRLSHPCRIILATLVGFVGSSVPAPAQVAPAYLLTDLGTLPGGSNSRAEGISPNNLVVGYSDIAGGNHIASAWTPSGSSFTISNLGTLAGDTQSEARAANASGLIVGFSTNTANTADKAVTFTVGGSPTNLNIFASLTQPPTAPVLANSRALAISPTGEIVGHVYSGNFNNLTTADGIRGFYRNATGTSVTRLDPSSGTVNYPADGVLSYGINSSSQVFGQADPGTGFVGARWSAPSGASALPTATYPTGGNPALTEYLGTQGNNANRMIGTAINDAGTVSQVFASDGTTTTLLNTLGGTVGFGDSINNGSTNIITGLSSNAGGSLLATAWNWSGTAGATPNPTAINLNNLVQNPIAGFTLVEAFGVNDNGWIVGYGTLNGNDQAFVLVPVPEPGTMALCSLGLGGLALRAWRRRRA